MVIESRLAFAFPGINEDEFFGTVTEIVAVPEAGVVLEPMGGDLGFVDAAFRPAETAATALFDGVDAIGGGESVVGGSDGGGGGGGWGVSGGGGMQKSQSRNPKSEKNPKTQTPKVRR